MNLVCYQLSEGNFWLGLLGACMWSGQKPAKQQQKRQQQKQKYILTMSFSTIYKWSHSRRKKVYFSLGRVAEMAFDIIFSLWQSAELGESRRELIWLILRKKYLVK